MTRTRFRFPVFIILLLFVPAFLGSHSRGMKLNDTPLHWASEHGVKSTVLLLLEQGADIDAVGWFGNTPLHVAVAYPEIVEILLQQGADFTIKNEFEDTPLHLAVRYPKSVEILLSYGADPTVRNAFDYTPIELCMRRGTDPINIKIIEEMLKASAK